jgi:hypothetical protein
MRTILPSYPLNHTATPSLRQDPTFRFPNYARPRAGRGAAILALLLVTAMASPARADCTKDTDCKGDRICDAGRCVAPKPQACSKDTDCAGSEVCDHDQCTDLTSAAAPSVAAPVPPPLPPPPAPVAAPPQSALPALPAPTGTVPVTIEGIRNRSATVDGMPCTMPCTMQLAPGMHELSTHRLNSFRFSVGTMPVILELKRAGSGVLIFGAVMTGIGGILAAAGSAVTPTCDDYGDCNDDAQTALYVAGGTSATLGLIMVIAGAANAGAIRVEENGQLISSAQLELPRVRPWSSASAHGLSGGLAISF